MDPSSARTPPPASHRGIASPLLAPAPAPANRSFGPSGPNPNRGNTGSRGGPESPAGGDGRSRPRGRDPGLRTARASTATALAPDLCASNCTVASGHAASGPGPPHTKAPGVAGPPASMLTPIGDYECRDGVLLYNRRTINEIGSKSGWLPKGRAAPTVPGAGSR